MTNLTQFIKPSPFQMEVLKEAKRVHPDSWWWIKADGCDIVSGLKESVKMEWSGDVDLNDGRVQELHKEYKKCLQFVDSVGVGMRRARRIMISDLHHLQEKLEIYLSFYPLVRLCHIYMYCYMCMYMYMYVLPLIA